MTPRPVPVRQSRMVLRCRLAALTPVIQLEQLRLMVRR